jgi:hypothetical protein
MNATELNNILSEHAKWLADNKTGRRADLSSPIRETHAVRVRVPDIRRKLDHENSKGYRPTSKTQVE